MNKELSLLAKELEQQFDRWDYYRANGCSDPFWPDGFNLNLLRNHIIYTKNQIRDQMKRQEIGELSLFPCIYPDVWYRETPPIMPEPFMVKADEILAHAKEQMERFLADPNFQYLKQQSKTLYSRGQTPETKAAGLPYYEVIGLDKYEKAIQDDDLVAMRRDFRESYESIAPRWAKYARQIHDYLNATHDVSANKTVQLSSHEHKNGPVPAPLRASSSQDFAPNSPKSDLQSRLLDAAARSAQTSSQPSVRHPEQLSLF